MLAFHKSTASRGVLITAVSLLALAVSGVTPASAADLGGDCCADHEERVSELEATAARKGNRKMTLVISGEVNQGYATLDVDSGFISFEDEGHFDGGTFVNLAGSGALNPDTKVGYEIEIGLAWDSGGSIDTSNVYLESGRIGKLTMGLQSQATDGAAQVALANTKVAQKMMNFGRETVFEQTFFDGGSIVGVRYDTPAFGPFVASAAYGSDNWDAALRFAEEYNGIRIAAAVGYRHEDDGFGPDQDLDTFMVSGGIIHMPSGVFLQGSYGNSDPDAVGADTTSGWHIQGGLEKNFTALGKTTLFAEYAAVDINTNLEATIWGIGIVQNLEAVASDIYLTFRSHDIETGGGDIDATSIVGMRVKF